MSKHVKECCGEATLSGEHGRKGLASILSAQCNKCKMAIEFPTSSVLDGSKQWECNLSAVWGQMATGGYTTLKEAMSIIGVPVMTKKIICGKGADYWEVVGFIRAINKGSF